MKIKTHLVSMLAGAALALIAAGTIAATSSPTPVWGRFQLLAADTYLFKIDTTTGQVWKTFVSSPGKDFMAPNVPAPTPDK